MSRYFSLYLYFVRFSLGKAMEFRVDFFFRVLMDTVYYAVNIAFFQVIFLHTGILGGWTETQMMVFVGCFLTVDALNMTFFASNVWWLPIYINRGDLDYHLTRPVSSLFMLSVRELAGNSLLNLFMAIAILGWALSGLPDSPGAGEIALLAVSLLLGAFLYFCVHMLTILPVFWMHSGRGLEHLFYNFMQFMERPDGIFHGWVRKALTTVLPFSVMASIPARSLLEGSPLRHLAHLSVVCFAFWLALMLVWRLALRSYSSASS